MLPKSEVAQEKRERAPTFAEVRQEIQEQGISKFVSSRNMSKLSPRRYMNTAHNDKLLGYDHDSLLTSRALVHIGMSVFGQRPVILTLAYCIVLAILSATAVFLIPAASKLDSTKFAQFAVFLKVFIAFMLGTYVTQAFKRWWFSVNTFEKFLISIQQLLFMLHTIHCRPDWRRMVEKYCICSGYMLNFEVKHVHSPEKLRNREEADHLDWLVENDLISPDESGLLKNMGKGTICAKSRAIWSWIGEMVSSPFVEEGVVVLPPLLVRSIVLCQESINNIEHLKMNITMQMPFIYAQLLAILVHANNSILAINCGMAMGSAFNEIRRRSEQLSGDRDTELGKVSVTEQLYGAVQTVSLQITILLIAPVLYVAFLHIAHMLCYPFGDESYHLPTETLLHRLHNELNGMADERAFIRKKHAEWKEMEKKKQKGGKKDDEEDDDDADGGDDCGE